jgi:hypothetical protein
MATTSSRLGSFPPVGVLPPCVFSVVLSTFMSAATAAQQRCDMAISSRLGSSRGVYPVSLCSLRRSVNNNKNFQYVCQKPFGPYPSVGRRPQCLISFYSRCCGPQLSPKINSAAIACACWLIPAFFLSMTSCINLLRFRSPSWAVVSRRYRPKYSHVFITFVLPVFLLAK